MVQGTRDTFFPYIPEKAQNHSHSARAHSHPDGHLRSVLPRAGISSDHWPPLLYLWHLGAAEALPRYLLFRTSQHLPSPSPSGRSSSYSLFCIQIGLVILSIKLVILSMKLEGSPDSQLEKELPTTYSTSV